MARLLMDEADKKQTMFSQVRALAEVLYFIENDAPNPFDAFAVQFKNDAGLVVEALDAHIESIRRTGRPPRTP